MHEPIFDFISFKNVHIDPLHEHIRIPSHLLNLTYRNLISFDNSKSFDLNKLVAQNRFIDWLKWLDKYPYSVKNESFKSTDPNFKLKSFSWGKCLKICKLIKTENISDLKDSREIAKLFNDNYRLHQGYKNNFYKNKSELFQERLDIGIIGTVLPC